MESPELRAAQKDLDAAVDKFLKVAREGDDPGVLTAYTLVGHIALSPSDDGEELGTYPMVFMSGSQPGHVARGLLQMGMRILDCDCDERGIL